MKFLSSATVLSVILLGYSSAAWTQDIAAGEKVFRKCASCHKVGEGAKNGVGPVLNNLFGRPAGSYSGYKYSKTLREANKAGLIWDPENVSAYISDPKAFMQGFLNDPKARPRMAFKLGDAQDRKDVIAYLQQFSDAADSGMPMESGAVGNQNKVASAPGENKICVRNASSHSHFFAAEGKGVERLTATLSPGQSLCAAAQGDGWAGIVSVYEAADGIEGCSRLVKSGTVEQMFKYVDFDRCFWSSNSAI